MQVNIERTKDGGRVELVQDRANGGDTIAYFALTRKAIEQLRDALDTWLKTRMITLEVVACGDEGAHQPHVYSGRQSYSKLYCEGQTFN